MTAYGDAHLGAPAMPDQPGEPRVALQRSRQPGVPPLPRKPRVALLLGNDAAHNSRSLRMAATLVEAGCAVVIVARRAPGLADHELRTGYEIVRIDAPRPRWLPAPGLPASESRVGVIRRASVPVRRLGAIAREGPGRALQAIRYLVAARLWAGAIEDAIGPADAWQADGLVMLPVALHLRSRLGGRAIYDALEIHVQSGRFARLPGPWRTLLAGRERTWARAADGVVTVSRPYADVLLRRLGVEPVIVMNCPPAPAAPAGAPPRRFHAMLGLPADAPVVLYHGYLFPNRGIERLFDAIAFLSRAHLVVMGFGAQFETYRSMAAGLPHADRVHVIPGVPPGELLGWVASADVAAMPIQGDTLNHRLTTPNKLFEAMAAGVPVVASDLPGMAPIVRETGAGLLCNPADPADIARAIGIILDATPQERAAYRDRALAAARETYNWQRQAVAYLGTYERLGLVERGTRSGPLPSGD